MFLSWWFWIHSFGQFFFFLLLFPSALTPNNLERQVFWTSVRVRLFPAVRFEPGTAGYEVRTLPLCYPIPPHSFGQLYRGIFQKYSHFCGRGDTGQNSFPNPSIAAFLPQFVLKLMQSFIQEQKGYERLLATKKVTNFKTAPVATSGVSKQGHY